MLVRYIGRFAIALCGVFLLDAPAFAQLDRSSLGAAREYVAATFALTEPVALPSNLHVTPMYRPIVESIARRSPTFRRQLMRIASEPLTTVDLRWVESTRIDRARATTRFLQERGGRMTAQVEFTRLDDNVELIAHEIEHIIERLDGVDLEAQAALRGTGVHAMTASSPVFGQVFETIRATRVGLKVTQEVRAAGPGGD